MSGYHGGPFGQSGDNPYKLPPPRTPANLQFAPDPFLRQRESDRSDLTRDAATADPPSARQTNEQLPSVRSLLTPATGSSSPPPYRHQTYGATTPSEPQRELGYPFRQQDPVFPPLQMGALDRRRSESLPHSQHASLPPLSHVAMTEPADADLHHHSTRSDPSTAKLAHAHLSPRNTSHSELMPSAEISSPESVSRVKPAAVLPHVVDERYIDGELCFVYADGSHQPKIVDGKPVNPNWGVTKAGKPRKRLAQACLTCREKKIKCQPNRPKCDQCQKSGRECRFENALRGNRSRGSHSIGPSGMSSDATSTMYDVTRASDSGASLPGSGHSPISESVGMTPSGMDITHDPMLEAERAYRQRAARITRPYEEEVLIRHVNYPEAERPRVYQEILGEISNSSPDDPLLVSWNRDPFDLDPEMTLHYVETFFTYVNDGLYHIFPRTRFLLWLKSCNTKSQEDKMVLHSMMALGSIFSDRPDKVNAFRRYSRIAGFAIQRGQHNLCLQLVQSHLIMSLMYYAAGSLLAAWDSIGSAGRVVNGLRFNIESGGVIVGQNQPCEYGLHPQALIECRRRTFWVAFLLDRISSFFSVPVISIPSDCALIRLPCREDIYEAQQYATAPYFQNILNQASGFSEEDRHSLSPMAFVIQILSIWADVSFQILRLSHTPPECWPQLAEEFHTSTIQRTEDWLTQLPEHLAFSVLNMERASQAKKVDAFVGIHMFYHATLMRLYRHARYQSLRSEILVRHIHQARYHAVEILRIALAVVQYAHDVQASRAASDSSPAHGTLLGPFLAYVVVAAVDVLSAGGMIAEVPNHISFINGAYGMVQLLGHHWDSSISLASLIKKRLDAMIDCANDRSRNPEKICFAVDGPSLESRVPTATPAQPLATLEEDLFYGALPREVFLRALKADDTVSVDKNVAWLREH
ncbi:Fungal Zn(2)-Cys(6) binuclear cluster domain-containing protein [Penicillium ucsense]|uniref:Fungal Zn(2)-Cys(6) binuclear cluster domain-containing protein n=1 Tax=Penicillium ucsense TaxID=2839758 RepID=A0A8J8W3U9_9EURO|nr:Fungal Zn(2)-Cys(6) binuclear cluster domain-containing protein [Penicillium ucsense]KAF7736442.1 Fungal Zn(2)-Cys(6) binuclear cluster domain-containing protein [Penicillium ucsense]